MFTRRKNHAGRVLPQQWVFGGICRETKEVFLYTVPDRSAATLMSIINQSIAPESTIISDSWRAYTNIANQPQLNHLTVNHKFKFVNPQNEAYTQTIERTWRSAKKGNKKRSRAHSSLLDSYLCKYMWRVKFKGDNLFEKIMEHIVEFYPPA